MVAQTPKPPYYAVIFTNLRTDVEEGYEETAEHMVALAKEMDGFLGIESVRNGLGITISYWESLEAIHAWKYQTEHVVARDKGRAFWYKTYKTRICKVERDYGFQPF